MRILILALPLLLASAREAHGQAAPELPMGINIPGHNPDSPPDPAQGARPFPGLEGRLRGSYLVLDWTFPAANAPAAFRILRPDGRLIATRSGRRSAQGWLVPIRVAGWPRGIYVAEAFAGNRRAAAKILLP